MIKRSPKANRRQDRGNNGRLLLLVVLGLIVLGAFGTGAAIGIDRLHDIWTEQCRVYDRELDVVITSGKMVHPDVITMHFGLTNGANLAEIPFVELRQNLLKRVPNIRDLRIERRQPNRVTIDVVEREPLVRLASGRSGSGTGYVADSEGMVFRFSSNTSLLPLVRETGEPPTTPGHKLTGNAAAALRMVEVASQPEFAELRILEIDTAHVDYLLVTLGNYDRAKVAWDHMLDDSRLARESLRRQLKHLTNAINKHLAPAHTLWIATDYSPDGRIYASDPARAANQ